VKHETRSATSSTPRKLKRVYYPEAEALIKKVPALRASSSSTTRCARATRPKREARLVREPVLNVHNDYTEWSGPQRVRDLVPGEAEALLQRRFAIIQVWRAINKPIQSNPLAIADARSLAPGDLIRAERRYPNRVGETYPCRLQPATPLVLFPRCGATRRCVFKVYESAKDGRARFTAHSSFSIRPR